MVFSRAGRFGTKGLAITFVSSESDQQVMSAIQSRFEVAVPELPDQIDLGSYSDSPPWPLCVRSTLLMALCSDLRVRIEYTVVSL